MRFGLLRKRLPVYQGISRKCRVLHPKCLPVIQWETTRTCHPTSGRDMCHFMAMYRTRHKVQRMTRILRMASLHLPLATRVDIIRPASAVNHSRLISTDSLNQRRHNNIVMLLNLLPEALDLLHTVPLHIRLSSRTSTPNRQRRSHTRQNRKLRNLLFHTHNLLKANPTSRCPDLTLNPTPLMLRRHRL